METQMPTFPSRIAVLLTALVLSSACPSYSQQSRVRHHRYRLIVVGTFGGPNSEYNVGTDIIRSIDGAFVGGANTPTPDPAAPNCFDAACFSLHAFEWRDGHVTDLGVLPGGLSSYPNAINIHGVVVGQSQNGATDLDSGISAWVPTVWKDGRAINLGTFGGSFGLATSVNESGLVTGAAENGVTDPLSFAINSGLLGETELRGFVWDGGRLRDIGTLGAPGTFPVAINNAGQVTGFGLTDSDTGPFGLPHVAPFVWQSGHMTNLGTLGGIFGLAAAINQRGQITGQSDLAGDEVTHAFLWSHGKMTDLGTLGGTFSSANFANELGDVTGISSVDDSDSSGHAFLWKNGTLIDILPVSGDNNGNGWMVNNFGQVVGQSWDFDGTNTLDSHAMLWENGESIDLNLLISNHTDITLTEANYITDKGEILSFGVLPNGELRATVLIPEPEFCFPNINPGPPRKHGPLPRKTIESWRHHPRRSGQFSRTP
jgi:probable HAF family extracellular repeat protein